ncbi:MAG: WD40 repeat domain-containing protein [Acidobacteria bacterium]|nr:WD40 repeat domain-containing protein [Acidobacteriota bacterium]
MNSANNSEEIFYDQKNIVCWQEKYLEEVWGQINSHIKNFVGRDGWLKILDDWVKTNSSGYFLLTGGAGFGKSALLAKFSQLKQNTSFIHMSRNSRNPIRILQFLSWQVAQIDQDNLSSYIYYSSLNDLRYYFIRLLNILLLEKDKIFIIIDDLDDLDINDLIKILPIKLPKNVYFFLAAREVPSLINTLEERLTNLTIKRLDPINSKEARLVFNSYLINNNLEHLSKNIGFQLMLKVIINLLLKESQNNITILKLIIESITKEIKNNIAENIDLEVCISKNNIKLSFITIYNRFLFTNKNTTKINQINIKQIIGLIAISYQALSVEELSDIFSINNIKIQQIKEYLSEIETYLIKLPNNKQVFFHHQFTSFVKDKLLETREITLLYDFIINWLENLGKEFLYYYLNYIDNYLLDYILISIKLNDKLKTKEICIKLLDLLTNIKFINNKISIGMFNELISTYKKAISIIPENLETDKQNKLLAWFKFLDSESYIIRQNIELDIFLQQAINQRIEKEISQKALKYLEEISLPYTYFNWLNKPEKHIYNALKENLISNLIGIQAIKLTSNNRYLILAGEDGKIKIWDPLTQEEIITLTKHSGIIFSLTIDVNNQYIASGDSNSIINIWDLTKKELLLSLKEHSGSILSLLITSDNKYLISTSVDRSVKIWNFNLNILINDQTPLLTLKEYNSIINTLTISIDNQYLILGSNDGKIIIWDLINKNEIISLLAHDFGITSLAVTSNNQYLISASEDRSIKVWDLATKTLTATLRGATSSISKVKITSDNEYIIAGSNDKTIHIWNLTTGLPITVLTGHNDLITDVEITSDNRYIISSSKDGDIKLWDLDYAKLSVIETKQRFNISSVTISLDGDLGVSAETSGLIKIWDIKNNQEIASISAHKSSINALALTSDNKYLVSAGDDFQVKVWDLATLGCIALLNDHQDRVLSLLITTDDKYIISASEDKTIKIWDLNKKILDTTLIDRAGVYGLMLGQDNRHFASANFRGKLRLWDLVTKRIIKEHKGWFDTKVAITKNNKYQVLRYEDNTLRVLDVANETVIAVFPTISLVIRSAISDNGVIISCDQLGNLYFLKLENIEY